MDYNSEEANEKQKRYLERIEDATNIIRNEVLNYYFEKYPDTEDEARENLDGIYRYLKNAREEINYVLDDLDRELGY
jgi:predicted solute-binding protein